MIIKSIILFFAIGFIANAQAIDESRVHSTVDSLILKQEFGKAESIALDAVKKYPGNPQVRCALACVYRNESRKSVLNVDITSMGLKEGENGTVPLDSAGLHKYFKEQISFDPELHKKAEKIYFTILESDPQYENAYYNLLNDYADMRDFGAYFVVIDKFIRNFTDVEVKKNSLIDLGSKLARDPGIDPEITIKMYKTILAAFPGYGYAKSDLGAMYHRQGRTAEAIPLFREAYESDPEDMITLTNYVRALVYEEQFNEAYRICGKLAEADTLSYYLSGLLGYITGKPYAESLSRLTTLRRASGHDAASDFWMINADALRTIDTKSKKERLEFFEYLLENFTGAKMSPEAVVCGNIALKLEQTNYTVMVLGGIYDNLKNLNKTLKYLDLISARRAANPDLMTPYDLYSNYARIYLVNDKFEKAQEYLLKTKGIKNPDARLNYYLGLCALGLGNKTSAVSYFEANSKLNDKDQMEWINNSIWKLRKLKGE